MLTHKLISETAAAKNDHKMVRDIQRQATRC